MAIHDLLIKTKEIGLLKLQKQSLINATIQTAVKYKSRSVNS